MKRNKGFTLVELLAVIVILAIIALIATPTILSMIENARQGAAESSMLSYIDQTEKQIVTDSMNPTNAIDYNKTYTVTGAKLTSGDVTLNLEIKGDQPASADGEDANTIKVAGGNVIDANLKFGTYYVTYHYDTENKKAVYCSNRTGFADNKTGSGDSIEYCPNNK